MRGPLQDRAKRAPRRSTLADPPHPETPPHPYPLPRGERGTTTVAPDRSGALAAEFSSFDPWFQRAEVRSVETRGRREASIGLHWWRRDAPAHGFRQGRDALSRRGRSAAGMTCCRRTAFGRPPLDQVPGTGGPVPPRRRLRPPPAPADGPPTPPWMGGGQRDVSQDGTRCQENNPSTARSPSPSPSCAGLTRASIAPAASAADGSPGQARR